jgi:hypothetical protein
MKTKAVSRVFPAEANTEHAVFLQEVRRWSVHRELLREVAYACEPESIDTESSVECCGVSRHISLYRRNRIHLPVQIRVVYICERNITHSYGVKQGISIIKIHRSDIKYITLNKFWFYQKVPRVLFIAKTWHFVYKCRNLFSFKQFLFNNCMLYRAEDISVFGKACNFKI